MKKTTAKISTIAMSLCLILSLQSLDAVCVYANPIDDKASQLVCWGAPVSSVTNNDQYLLRTTYAVHYLYRTKTAEYVCEHLTKNAISGPAKRKDDFRPDPEPNVVFKFNNNSSPTSNVFENVLTILKRVLNTGESDIMADGVI